MIPIHDDNPYRQTPYITITLIVLNILVFLYEILLGPGQQAFVYKFGAIPFELTHFKELPNLPVAYKTPLPNIFTVFTSMFIHGGVLHLLGNMLYLWIFGDNVEYLMGRFRFLIFYLIVGFIAAFAYTIMDPNSTVPMIGASGAISGVLGAYAIKFPKARVRVLIFLFIFITTVQIPAYIVLGFWFFIQLLSGFSSIGNAGVGVAWWAHIGGFLAGMILVNKFQKRKIFVWWR